MSFGEAIQSCFNNYANFNGRAPRSEHNFWVLFTFIVGIVTAVLDIMIFGIMNDISPINTLISIAFFLPGLAVQVRRLHDINKSGWNLLWIFTCIGIFVVAYWNYFKAGDEGENLYGPDPFG